MMTTALGRRQYARVAVRWPVTLLTSQNKIEGKTENVSPAGAFLCCKEPPVSQGNLRMVIKIPGHQPIQVTGKVVWSKDVNPKEEGYGFGAGVSFTKISTNDSQFLSEVILKRYGKMIKRSVGGDKEEIK
jgi:hypothetical protein